MPTKTETETKKSFPKAIAYYDMPLFRQQLKVLYASESVTVTKRRKGIDVDVRTSVAWDISKFCAEYEKKCSKRKGADGSEKKTDAELKTLVRTRKKTEEAKLIRLWQVYGKVNGDANPADKFVEFKRSGVSLSRTKEDYIALKSALIG